MKCGEVCPLHELMRFHFLALLFPLFSFWFSATDWADLCQLLSARWNSIAYRIVGLYVFGKASHASCTLMTAFAAHVASSVVCVSVRHTGKLCGNGWTDRDAIERQTRVGPRNLYNRSGSRSSREGTLLKKVFAAPSYTQGEVTSQSLWS